MSDKKAKNIVEQISSIDDEVALKLLCRIAGSTKTFADISGIPYYKINNILQGKSTIRQDMLLSFYRDTLTDEFRNALENTYLLVTALAELGIIKPGPSLTEMDEFEAKVFTLTHDEPEPKPEETLPATFVAEVTSGGEPKQILIPLKTDPKKFGFRSKKPLDKGVKPAYSISIMNDLIDNVENFVSEPLSITGDILESVKIGGTEHATAIGDPFEAALRSTPDKYDSDNKRW